MKFENRKAVSPVIATLLLIAIAVAAAIIVYAFVTGLIGGLSSSGSPTLIVASGTLTLPSGQGNGTLIVNVRNSAGSPITSIITSTSGLVSAHSPMTFSGLPLGIGDSTGAASTTNADISGIAVETGQTYTLVLSVTFANGSIQQVPVQVTAEI